MGVSLPAVMLSVFILLVTITCIAMSVLVVYHRLRYPRTNGEAPVWTFFHPHCSSGGGGERVLWKMCQVLGALVDRGFSLRVMIYTVDASTPSYRQDLLSHVKDRFDIVVSANLKLDFVHLSEHKHLLDPAGRFSLLLESIGTLRLAYRGYILQYQQTGQLPDVFLDTTGCAFTFVVAKLFGSLIVPYVHYPTISTDMLQVVWERRPPAYSHGENAQQPGRISSIIKLVYYLLFAALYGAVGSVSTRVLVNSTWTYNHIRSLWKGATWLGRIQILYPPCRVAAKESLKWGDRKPVVLSIGQFRPEKDHTLQLRALECLRRTHPNLEVSLVMLGSCRGPSDESRLKSLQQLALSMGLSKHVEFVVNQPYSVVEHWLRTAKVGLHTMWNEHFGIGIVEMMASGLLVVAHNSGGPKLDIVKPNTGFLASSAEEYADAIFTALTMKNAKQMQELAVESSLRFSDDTFDQEFEQMLVSSGLPLR